MVVEVESEPKCGCVRGGGVAERGGRMLHVACVTVAMFHACTVQQRSQLFTFSPTPSLHLYPPAPAPRLPGRIPPLTISPWLQKLHNLIILSSSVNQSSLIIPPHTAHTAHTLQVAWRAPGIAGPAS